MLIKFQPCLIQSIELNYSPQGIPAFFEGTSHPAFIECSITMLETQIQTSRDYGREGGDRISEGGDALFGGLQKAIDKINNNPEGGNEIQTILSEFQEIGNGILNPKATTPSSKEQTGS